MRITLTAIVTVSLTSRNAGSVATRTVGSAVYNMTVQISSIIASNVSALSSTIRYPNASF